MALLPEFRIVSTEALGPFSWRWPEGLEYFERGWITLVDLDGVEVQVRHGIGRRTVFGASRPHSVTWVDNEPTVEGVGADDYDKSHALLSLIKVTKKHLRPHDAVPAGYAEFEVAVMADAASGPYSPRSLAVKIGEGGPSRLAHRPEVVPSRSPKVRNLPPHHGVPEGYRARCPRHQWVAGWSSSPAAAPKVWGVIE